MLFNVYKWHSSYIRHEIIRYIGRLNNSNIAKLVEIGREAGDNLQKGTGGGRRLPPVPPPPLRGLGRCLVGGWCHMETALKPGSHVTRTVLELYCRCKISFNVFLQ